MKPIIASAPAEADFGEYRRRALSAGKMPLSARLWLRRKEELARLMEEAIAYTCDHRCPLSHVPEYERIQSLERELCL